MAAHVYKCMHIVSVVGARTNFMKIAAVLAEPRGVPDIEHFLVHTGQHYDRKHPRTLSRIQELGLQHFSAVHQCQRIEVLGASRGYLDFLCLVDTLGWG